MNYKIYLFIFIGSGLGGVLRYSISRFFIQFFPIHPFGTLMANLLGMFLIGLFSVWSIDKSLIESPFKEMILIGFLGGLTTLSSFGLESYNLLKEGKFDLLVYYFVGNIVIGFCLLIIGRIFAEF